MGQLSNTLDTGINVTTIKQIKKQYNKDLSQVNYFTYYNQGYYGNKYRDKESKTSIGLGNPRIDDRASKKANNQDFKLQSILYIRNLAKFNL